jgi:hypothetical protein
LSAINGEPHHDDFYVCSISARIHPNAGQSQRSFKESRRARGRKNIAPEILLQARLFPDMFALIRQVQIAADFAKGVAGRLAESELPAYEDNEQTFADLQTRIAKTKAFISSLDAAKFAGSEEREIILRPGTPKEKN